MPKTPQFHTKRRELGVQEALQKLHELQKMNKDGDIEANHRQADQVLCELLNSLGFYNVVEEYEKIKKWYA